MTYLIFLSMLFTWVHCVGWASQAKNQSAYFRSVQYAPLHNFFTEVFKPFIWQLPLARFQSILTEEFDRPPFPLVCHKGRNSLRSVSCDFTECSREPSAPVLCFEIYCLREWEGDKELAVQETWERKTSNCCANTFFICMLYAVQFLHIFLKSILYIFTLFTKEIKLENTTYTSIWAISKNAVWISLDIKCHQGADLNQLLFVLIVKSMQVHSLRSWSINRWSNWFH